MTLSDVHPGRSAAVCSSGMPQTLQTRPCMMCSARSLGFCGRLNDRTLGILSRRSRRVSLAAGTEVKGSGAGTGVTILQSGFLRCVHYGADGRRRILGMVEPGEAIEPREQEGDYELEAATEVGICSIDAANYRQALSEDPAVRRVIFAQARSRIERLRQLSVALAVLSPEERLATFLVNCTTQMPWQPLPGGGGVLTVEVDRPDIADLLGTTVESVSRITHRFDDEGLIRIRDPRTFEIPDRGRLARRGWLAAERLRNEPTPMIGPSMTPVNEPLHGILQSERRLKRTGGGS